jgi:hypothetical protein
MKLNENRNNVYQLFPVTRSAILMGRVEIWNEYCRIHYAEWHREYRTRNNKILHRLKIAGDKFMNERMYF